MAKLIKAEWYRLRHSGNWLVYIIIMAVFSFAMVFLIDPNIHTRTLDNAMGCYAEAFTMSLTYIATVVIAALAMIFHNRTGYYEVMDGNRISSIILSKVVVHGVLITALIVVPIGVLFTYIGCANGIGDMPDVPVRLVLLFVIFLHVMLSSILFTLTIKSLISAAIPYVRYMIFEYLGLTMLTLIYPDNTLIAEISEWFPMMQCMYVSYADIDTGLIVKVIASFVIETILMYIAAHVAYKKKNFRK